MGTIQGACTRSILLDQSKKILKGNFRRKAANGQTDIRGTSSARHRITAAIDPSSNEYLVYVGKLHLHNIKATSTFILRYNALIQTLQRSPNTLGIQGLHANLFVRQTDVINGQ